MIPQIFEYFSIAKMIQISADLIDNNKINQMDHMELWNNWMTLVNHFESACSRKTTFFGLLLY